MKIYLHSPPFMVYERVCTSYSKSPSYAWAQLLLQIDFKQSLCQMDYDKMKANMYQILSFSVNVY